MHRMKIEDKLYTKTEVFDLIQQVVAEVVALVGAHESELSSDKVTVLKQWAEEMYPQVCSVIAQEVSRRHVQGVTLAVWSGPPGSGKGTNIAALQLFGKIYAEVVSQGGASQLPLAAHERILEMSLSQGMINTGTKGMFNMSEGEYKELFAPLAPIISGHVTKGGFVSDSMVSVFVGMMVWYRLTQGYHKIQIDLWPRTVRQLADYRVLVSAVQRAQGKIFEEFVNLKVLSVDEVFYIREHLNAAIEQSKVIASAIRAVQLQQYQGDLVDVASRFKFEQSQLQLLMKDLKKRFSDQLSMLIIKELETVCDRMAFRFGKTLEKGELPRSDEFPLTVVRRLAIYTAETSPAFLLALANKSEKSVLVVSANEGPAVVVANILDSLLKDSVENDSRWEKIKEIVGELAIKIVHKEEIIVDTYVERVGGILNSI